MARSSSRRGRRRRQTKSAQAAPRPRRADAAPPTAASPDTTPAAAEIDVETSRAEALPSTPLVRPRRSTPRPTAAVARERGRFYRLTHPGFVVDIVNELRKVVWPSRMETRNLTIVVLVVAVTIGAFLGAVDWGFNRIMENVLLP